MTALVTGGAGCIGSELVVELLRRGTACIVYDNFSSGKTEHLEPVAGDPNLRVIEGDVLDLELLTSAMQGVDFVWHFAANPDVEGGKAALGSASMTILTVTGNGTSGWIFLRGY